MYAISIRFAGRWIRMDAAYHSRQMAQWDAERCAVRVEEVPAEHPGDLLAEFRAFQRADELSRAIAR
jgi:hypothetical protein